MGVVLTEFSRHKFSLTSLVFKHCQFENKQYV